jgi:phage terminase large subunit-like protein
MPERPDRQPTAADIARWIEKLVVPDGALLGQNFKLAPFQIDILQAIYDAPHRPRRVILSLGRKNSKTSTCALLLLAHLVGPMARVNSQLYSTALSRDQAGVLYNIAAKIARLSPLLRGYIRFRDSSKELICDRLGIKYRALSAEATTAHGLSPSLVVHDELGQQRGPRSALYEALETATGAQVDPLSIVISTQAPTDGDLLSLLIDDALANPSGSTVCKLWTAPVEDDPFDIETIRKANPALGSFLLTESVLQMADDARRMPSREAEYRNLILNQRVEATRSFIQPAQWKACGGAVAPIDDGRTECYCGLDLSEVADLTALVIIGKVDKVWQVHPVFWLPTEGLHQRSRADRVIYDEWAKQGYLRLTPGATVSYEYVAKELWTIFGRYNIRKIGFDRWNYRHLKPWLVQAGFNEATLSRWVEFGQGTQSMSPALRALEEAILDRRLCHGNHPVLTMCMANSTVEGNDSSNRKLSKRRSTGRIDGAVALAMAMGVAPLTQPIDVSLMIA